MIDHDVNITGFIYDKNDTGDETASRYRYQWIYAAIMCCMLLDDTQHVTEVYCEKLEDVLLKYDDDTFSGLQVKTRASNQEPWKTSDEDVIKSFARFVHLIINIQEDLENSDFLLIIRYIQHAMVKTFYICSKRFESQIIFLALIAVQNVS